MIKMSEEMKQFVVVEYRTLKSHDINLKAHINYVISFSVKDLEKAILEDKELEAEILTPEEWHAQQND